MEKQQFNPSDSVGYYVYNISKLMNARLNRKFIEAGHDVTTEQWKILVQLWIQDGQNQKELSDLTLKNKVSATYLIDGLEKRNLVVRIPDAKDRRVKRIYLTAKGKELKNDINEVAEENNEFAQQGIDEQEIELIKNIMRRILKNVSNSKK